MKAIVGLGNPGSSYSSTRHNIGRLLVEFIAAQFQISFAKKKTLKSSVASTQWDGQPILLAYPETLMNVSGESIAALVRHFKLDPEKDLLILVDDSALPFGKFRLRQRGSAGGHNGLKSIEGQLSNREYSRLRIGIGEPAGQSLEDYVLSPFEPQEKKEIRKIYKHGLEASRLWIKEPIERAMNVVNSSVF